MKPECSDKENVKKIEKEEDNEKELKKDSTFTLFIQNLFCERFKGPLWYLFVLQNQWSDSSPEFNRDSVLVV